MVSASRLPPEVPDELDQRLLMNNVAWTHYEVMLALRGDAPVPKMTYLKGVLELMSPSRTHQAIKKLIGALFEAFALERGIIFDGYGSMTMRSAPEERGIEPDECYAIGGKKERPDLAIEVIWTSGGLNKLEVYRGLGVREVWIWEENEIAVHALRNERYERISQSQLVPDIDLRMIAELVSRGDTQSETVRAFLQSIRKR